ncbi:MAG: hypothetical protein OFPI_34670 [Osedax symbiont Rs2]|nr:MAG: hypothetical protein OFPI_34670 [Osedax symbiont Rs2]
MLDAKIILAVCKYASKTVILRLVHAKMRPGNYSIMFNDITAKQRKEKG